MGIIMEKEKLPLKEKLAMLFCSHKYVNYNLPKEENEYRICMYCMKRQQNIDGKWKNDYI
jgi:hypothetical protein